MVTSKKTINSTVSETNVKHKVAMLIFIICPILGLIFAIFSTWERYVTILDIALLLGLWLLTGLGVTIGYHRLLTHKGFQCFSSVRFVFYALGSMAMEGGALTWKAVHAVHHELSDKEGDPHSPLQGFIHAHCGWLFTNYSDRVYELRAHFMHTDKMARWFERTFAFWVVLSLVLPATIGGLSGFWSDSATWSWSSAWWAFVWGGLVRYGVTNHVTWSVNSICHMFGSRQFSTDDQSRNHLIVALLSFGEGWHNNHHAFPTSPRHGLRWYQFDPSWYIISTLRWLNLVWGLDKTLPDWQHSDKLIVN